LLEKRLSLEIRAMIRIPFDSPGNNFRNEVPARIFSLGQYFKQLFPVEPEGTTFL
jgi:hypothetical protein